MKKIVIMLCVGTILCGTLAGCGNKAQDEYADTMESGLNKYYSGDSMSKSEYRAVKNYKKWESNQGEKTYSEWDSQN